jgi:hypothetical protein
MILTVDHAIPKGVLNLIKGIRGVVEVKMVEV